MNERILPEQRRRIDDGHEHDWRHPYPITNLTDKGGTHHRLCRLCGLLQTWGPELAPDGSEPWEGEHRVTQSEMESFGYW